MANDLDIGSSSGTLIRYKTQHNRLASQKAGKDMSVARVYVNNTYSLTDLANRIVQRGSFVKKPDIKYVLDTLSEVMQDLLMEGNAIDVGGLVKLTPVITGVFEDGERFNANKHAIVIKATSGKVLRKVASDTPVEKLGGSLTSAVTAVMNMLDCLEDTLYAQGTTAVLKGKNLTFDATAADEGLTLSCPEYEGDDLAIEIIKATAGEIAFKVKGAVNDTYTAYLTLNTRHGDKNADVSSIKKEVTLAPAPTV